MLLLSLSTILSGAATASESKWSIDNFLSVKDIETSTDNQLWTSLYLVTPDRQLAEMYIGQQDYALAIKLLNSSITTLREDLPVNDLRIRSYRLALVEALLKKGEVGKAVSNLKPVLEQYLSDDRSVELKRLPKASRTATQESETALDQRYLGLRKMVAQNTRVAVLRRAQLLLFEDNISESLRLTRICTLLANGDGKMTNKYGKVDDSNLHFIQAIIFRKLGDKVGFDGAQASLQQLNDQSDLTTFRKALTEAMSLQMQGRYKDSTAGFLKVKQSIKTDSEQDKFKRQILTWLSGDNLAASGDMLGAYLEYNGTFEDSRRHVDGFPDGLFYLALERSALRKMLNCIEVRFSQVVASEVVPPTFNLRLPSPRQTAYCELLSTVGRDSVNGALPAPSVNGFEYSNYGLNQQIAGDTTASGKSSVEKFSTEDLQALAGALYHVAYQYKPRNKPIAQRLFWQVAYIREHYQLPDRKSLVIALYDLAESYYWEQKFDVATEVFKRCIQVGLDINPSDKSYILTHSTLGRVYLAKGDGSSAIKCMKRGLHLLICREKMQASRISRLMSDIKRDKLNPGPEEEPPVVSQLKTPQDTETFVRQLSAQPLPVQLDVVAETRKESNPEVHPQIDDLCQVLADSYSSNRRYDEAVEVSKRLLDTKKHNPASSSEDVLGSLWQVAYICGVSGKHNDAVRFYSELIENHAKTQGRPLADWLSSRGVVYDSLGEVDAAKADFRTAIKNYKKTLTKLDKIKDAEQIQQIGWMVGDLKFELKSKSRCPEDSTEYTKAYYPRSYWRKERYPLRVFIDNTEERGFGPQLYGYLKKSVDEWKRTKGMEDKFVFVDDREKADIYFERVSNYDLIPYGSGGVATASYVQGRDGKPTMEIEKVHLRLYCQEHDLDQLSSHAIEQLYNLALHEFGHGLGLGHSPSGRDVMYWKSAMKELSERDRATLLKASGFKVERAE
ncbi:MAG: matrixin family metalloprotease [Candidatus Obscuribacterales bacterium]|nr:matrixin family metalloprotease [Candidatus Obscuribacterales bacterium]